MLWHWGFILLFASNALAAVSSSDSPKTGKSLERQTSTLFRQQGLSFFGRLGRSVPVVPDLLRRSLPIIPTFVQSTSPTSQLDTVKLAEYYGYGAERHSVTTEDGYILEVHRMYNNTVGQGSTEAKPVVIVQHGFVMDSKAFLVLGPGKALGYFLADAGYDVWLSNFRGNTYSRRHKTLLPHSKEFWDFSYTEHGTYDLPAVINYALKVSGRSKAHYIGHSMGTLSFFVMASKRPEMLSKVLSYTALAPITTATDGRASLLKMIMNNYKTLADGFEQAGVFNLFSKDQKMLGLPLCSTDNWQSKVACTSVIYSLTGENPYFDKSIIDDILADLPAGSSVKTLCHFGQNYFNGFREYDYGAVKNIAKYNSKEPPTFDYSNMKVPTQLYYGINDLVADAKGAIGICNIIPETSRCEAVNDILFGHGDFIWATNAPSLVYERLLEGLRRHGDDNQQ